MYVSMFRPQHLALSIMREKLAAQPSFSVVVARQQGAEREPG
jgi:hypothetical protein